MQNNVIIDTITMTKVMTTVVVLTFVIVIVSMITLFCTIQATEQNAASYSSAAAERRNQKKVMKKAILLIGTFIVVYTPSLVITVRDIILNRDISDQDRIWIALTLPCQVRNRQSVPT